MTSKDLRTEYVKAKIGSAKHGMRHWLSQRISALVIALCIVWIFYFTHNISEKSASDIVLILQKPVNVIFLMILTISSLYHAMLGIQVVIEDYISNICIRNALIILLKIFVAVTILSSTLALFYIMVL